jgi:hypothetical protein
LSARVRTEPSSAAMVGASRLEVGDTAQPGEAAAKTQSLTNR